MENGNRTMDLVIDWKKHDYPIKDKLNAVAKEKVKEALVFGKMVAVNHWNYKKNKMTRDQMAFYANNTLVYVAKSGCPRQRDNSRDSWVYEIQGVHFLKNTSIPESITYPKPIVFQNKAHVDTRTFGRVVSKIEVIHAINNGLFVCDHSANKKTGYVFYDRYYFCNDVCVVARESKNEITVNTVYRITPIGDNNFLKQLSKFEWGLQNHLGGGNVNFGIKNETAERKWHESDEYWDHVMVESIKSGNSDAKSVPGPWQRRIRFLNIYSLYHSSKENKRYLEHTIPSAAWMKLVEFGGIPYFWKGKGPTFKDFAPLANHEYSFIIDIESAEDSLTKRQVRYLQLLGLDLEKYPHERIHKDGNLRLKYSMHNFSVNPQPWAHNNWGQEEIKYGA